MNEGIGIFAHLANMRVKAIIRVIQDSGVILLRIIEDTRGDFATQAEELLE
jgi:hypothetical protein